MLNLSDWLRKQGHQVDLGGAPADWSAPEVLGGGIFHPLPIGGVTDDGGALPWRMLALVRSVAGLRPVLRHERYDIVHSHESAPALVARLAGRGLGVRQVVTYHGSAPERVAQFAHSARHADLLITPSHASARDLEQVGGFDPQRLKVIGLGLGPPPDAHPKEIARLRADLLGDGRQLVVTVARITHQKGIDILIECVARLRASHPHLRFALVGPGEAAETRDMQALAAQKGVADILRFVGPTERVHDYLRASDLLLMTSRWESLPLIIPEAFQVATPVVATACSGVVELVDDSVGAVPPIGDVPAICLAVADLLDDPDRLASAGAQALLRSGEDRFDPKHIHRQFELTYQGLLAQP